MKYFLHIPKTGGTSVLSVMSKAVCNTQMLEIYAGLTSEMVNSFKPISSTKLVFGHFSHGIHRMWNDRDPRYVTILRNPCERVASLYQHHLRTPTGPMHVLINEQKYSLIDFVESGITPETNNGMVRHLSASYHPIPLLLDRMSNMYWNKLRGSQTRQISESFRLKRCFSNIRQRFEHVGTTENLATSMAFLKEWLALSDDFSSSPRENVMPGERIKLTATEVSVIENANGLDLELYRAFGKK